MHTNQKCAKTARLTSERTEMELVRILFTAAAVLTGCFFFRLYGLAWINSARLARKLRKQGVRGPPPSLWSGNTSEMHRIQAEAKKRQQQPATILAHDYTSTLFPYFEQWRRRYGSLYMYSTGSRHHLYINDPELVKEMNLLVTLSLGKPTYVTRTLTSMLGNGILRSNGQLWALHRKIIAPEFYMDKVKGMMEIMLQSTQPLLQKWADTVDAQGGLMADIMVDEDLRSLTGDVIARACFGSSYQKGREIFSKLRSLQKVLSSQQGILFSGVPSFRFLMKKKQKEAMRLESEIEGLIWETVKERREKWSETNEKDLLQSILEGAMNDDSHLNADASKKFIVDNCKNIYFAGHESTAVAASWCLMLLALHPEWQDRVRKELSEVCVNGTPDSNSLLQTKEVTLVIQEAMRLYPPGAFVSREVLEETQIGHIVVPKGVYLWTLIPTLHRDVDIWGPDANEFKPERFANGVSKACKVPQAYVPFGLGPRLCLGRNFAMVQMKVLLSLIISKFRFSLSPAYQHSPAYRMIVEPEHGVQIVIHKI
uniref:Cytochrome P450 n=1 Tax=Kalanchoe fedtschenkoi TaxID=63787 RepID=A0A7N0UH21_KALFE